MDRLEKIVTELDELRDKAHAAGEEIILEKLAALELRYHRHTFQLIDGMGTTFFVIDPPFLGEKHLNEYFPNALIPKAYGHIVDELYETLNEILSVVDRISEEFRMDMGDIQPKRKSK